MKPFVFDESVRFLYVPHSTVMNEHTFLYCQYAGWISYACLCNGSMISLEELRVAPVLLTAITIDTKPQKMEEKTPKMEDRINE